VSFFGNCRKQTVAHWAKIRPIWSPCIGPISYSSLSVLQWMDDFLWPSSVLKADYLRKKPWSGRVDWFNALAKLKAHGFESWVDSWMIWLMYVCM
jgi:hypothetical protein